MAADCKKYFIYLFNDTVGNCLGTVFCLEIKTYLLRVTMRRIKLTTGDQLCPTYHNISMNAPHGDKLYLTP